LEGSLRNTRDGYVYLGCKKNNGKNKDSEPLNDFIIPSKDKETEQRHRGRHVQIEFSIEKLCYTIKDLGIGFGAFVRLENPLELKDNHLLNMGESFIIVNLINEKFNALNFSTSTHDSKVSNSQSNMKLRLKLFGGPSTGEVFYFKPDSDIIKLGRSTSCDVAIEDAVLSKLQAHIYFNHDKDCWVLEDGINNKRSLNGTWLYLNEDFEIYNGMTFKANQTLFQAAILN
jgi:hypothetical protein